MRTPSVALTLAALLSTGAAVAQDKPAEAPKKRQKVVSNLSGFELTDPAKLKDMPVVAGATRSLFGGRPPVAMAPFLARVFTQRPVLTWSAAGENFLVTLTPEGGGWTHMVEAKGTSVAWPEDARMLEVGKTYRWTVRASEPATAPQSEPVSFVIADAAARNRIEKALAGAQGADEYAMGLARAKVFVDERLWYDAIATYTALIAKDPKRPEAFEKRGEIYAQIQATQAFAEEDFGKAASLHR